ncbi:hypothetical protein AVEN_239659-1 [Araneus ventricosus]|uniref:DIX domain-containing protein n=1 Tax=Araneus ventricosus TaxID=182803 RepID=A0A4Y2CR59_ARAVE|nr:hypothetical protein AVEN_239659-1 [Araneus ventricosus]
MRPVPESVATMATKDPAKFHAILEEKLQRVEEKKKIKEKFNERYQGIEPFHPFQLQPSEDNAHDILDAHVSRVFKDTPLTPTLSSICNSPPVMKLTEENPLRVPPPGQNDHIQDMLNSYSQRVGQPSSFAVPYAMRYNRRDLDNRSSDAGVRNDWTCESNLQSSYWPVAEFRKHSQHERNRNHQLKRFSEKTPTDSSNCVDCGDSVARELPPVQRGWHSNVFPMCNGRRWQAGTQIPKRTQTLRTKNDAVMSWLNSNNFTEHSQHQPFEEDNAQDIIDAHVSRVFKDTGSKPTLSPICNSPTGEDPLRVPLPGQNDQFQIMFDNYPQRVGQPSPCSRRYNGQNLGTRSSDSRALTDWTSEDNFQSLHRPIDYVSSSESLEYSQLNRNRDHQLKRCRGKNQKVQSCWHSKSKEQSKNSLLPNFMDKTSSHGRSSDIKIIVCNYDKYPLIFKSRFPGKNITLKQFKSLLSKKGNWQYFFKRASNDFGTGVVLEEVSDDSEILPLWEGIIFCVIESMDDNATNDE